MKYNNRLFPHPVLGIGEENNFDVLGEFVGELTYESDKDKIRLSPRFKLIEDEISKLTSSGKAFFVTQVYCRGTMYREIFKSNSTLPDPIEIPSFKLSGEVEVDFFICPEFEISRYYSPNFNPEYSNTTFSLDKSDIIAYGGKGKFVANKTPEEVKSVSSLIRIVDSEETGKKPMYLEFDGDKIRVMLCHEDYENYQLVVRGGKAYASVLHSSIVLPALNETLHFMASDEAEEFSDRRWHIELKKYKDSSDPDCLKLAQRILDQPVNRSFGAMLTLIEES